MDDTQVFHLQLGRKAYYVDCHRQFLPQNHPHNRNKKAFTKIERKGKLHVQAPNVSLLGPSAEVMTFMSYFVNGYNFYTEVVQHRQVNDEFWVCVKNSSYTDMDNDFNGILEEIIQLHYPLIPNLHVILFKCCWVDPIRGMKVNLHYHLVDVNSKNSTQKMNHSTCEPEELILVTRVTTDN
ncbi:UNVERIFIED_CONTAM: hypothetical protein Slati_4204800 [Sesamum latifolium]|uniref:DUF4216 domain-containing protein n=1 Tax=Sesamum latifolium TaxID=2727402 RepID=A0AAW2TBD2_9LAMI